MQYEHLSLADSKEWVALDIHESITKNSTDAELATLYENYVKHAKEDHKLILSPHLREYMTNLRNKLS